MAPVHESKYNNELSSYDDHDDHDQIPLMDRELGYAQRPDDDGVDDTLVNAREDALRRLGATGSTSSLPRGAMPPVNRASYQPLSPSSPALSPNRRPPSAGTGAGSPGAGHVQFATYPDTSSAEDHYEKPYGPSNEELEVRHSKGWTPPPLRPWFWVPFVLLLAGIAIGLEVALAVSNKRNGWPTSHDGTSLSTAGWWHYAYTIPPVFIAGIIVALWTWTDVEVKKLQPYVDLVRGDASPQTSLLLDYTRVNNFFMPTRAMAHKHYLVALASLMSLLLLAFQPLAAAVFEVRDTTWTTTTTKRTQSVIGLNQGAGFQDLSVFLTAAGFASASTLYALDPPPFITRDGYSVPPFELPSDIATNGTARVNASAILSDPGCEIAPVTMDMLGSGNWNNSATFNGCTFSWNVSKEADHLFGTDLVSGCADDTPEQFRPLAFWFFTYVPFPNATIAFCTQKISLWDVQVDVSIATGNITNLAVLGPLTSSSNFSSAAGNVTGAPLNGQAYNGIRFPFANSSADPFVVNRESATQFTLPAAVFQAAQLGPGGLDAAFATSSFVGFSTTVYRTFLTLVAKTVYTLTDNSQPVYMEVSTIKSRLFLSPVAVHLLACGLFVLAFFATLLQLLHRGERDGLRLAHKPGTLASAMTIGGKSDVSALLAGHNREDEIVDALRDKRFRIDPRTMKIVMQGEQGYESAATPRKSMFHFEGLAIPGNRFSRRFSRRMAGPPQLPLTPRSTA